MAEMRRTVWALLALPALAAAFAPGSVHAPGLRRGPRAAFARRSAGLGLARGAGRAATLQTPGLRMVQDSGNAVHYEPFLGLEERDACGVGFVANRDGSRNHDIVAKVCEKSVSHRGPAPRPPRPPAGGGGGAARAPVACGMAPSSRAAFRASARPAPGCPRSPCAP